MCRVQKHEWGWLLSIDNWSAATSHSHRRLVNCRTQSRAGVSDWLGEKGCTNPFAVFCCFCPRNSMHHIGETMHAYLTCDFLSVCHSRSTKPIQKIPCSSLLKRFWFGFMHTSQLLFIEHYNNFLIISIDNYFKKLTSLFAYSIQSVFTFLWCHNQLPWLNK